MGEAVGEVLMLAVATALTPVPIVLMAMVLGAGQGRTRGIAVLAGWVAGLVVVGVVVLTIAPQSPEGGPPTWVSVTKLALGVALWWLALRQWRARPPAGKEAPVPSWAAAVDRSGAAKLGAIAFATAAVNPKTLLLGAAAATSIARTDASPSEQLGAYFVFVAIGSLGVAVPLVLALVLGVRADELLARLNTWLIANNALIVAVLFLVIGAKLVGDAIVGLSG
ncbi:MAG: GAP family protein [Gaiella sp.]